jgi:hypothetical protein
LNVTVADVLAGAEVRAVPLSAECVGYLVLAAADQICGAPRRVAANDVLLFEDGGVRVASARASEGPVAERDLRAVLDALLLRSSAPTGGLLRASRRAPGAGIEALVRELETALIPVNRSAAKRALARLERETVRALASGRIRPSSAPPAEPEPSVAPAPVGPAPVVAAREPSAAPPPVVSAAVAVREPSVAPPPVALPPVESVPVAPSLTPHAPVVAATVALPVTAVASNGFEPHDQTLVLAPVAPRESPDAVLAETRPEPVVARASARPPAPPVAEPSPAEPVRTEPLPRVAPLPPPVPEPPPFAVAAPPPLVLPAELVAAAAAPEALVAHPVAPVIVVTMDPSPPPVAVAPESAPAVTPVLGTRIFETDVPVRDAAPPVLDVSASPVAEDDELEIVEVLFGQDELTILPGDEELIYSEGSDWTEPCPPLAAESMLPPANLEVAVAASAPAEAVPIAEPCEPLVELEASEAAAIREQDEAPSAEQSQLVTVGQSELAPEDQSELAPEGQSELVQVEQSELAPVEQSDFPPEESELPPWIGAAPEEVEVTPPPRVALPEPKPSDVNDLLLNLAEVPLAVDDLRSGLKRLAGMEPTPPPPGTWRGD